MSAAPGNGVVDPMNVVNGSGPAHGGSPDAGQAGASGGRPEIAVGAAFAGGFLLAVLLRKIRS